MLRRFDVIAENPTGNAHSKRLTGYPGFYTSRVGMWRIIYKFNEVDGSVVVEEIGPRGQVYRRLQ